MQHKIIPHKPLVMVIDMSFDTHSILIRPTIRQCDVQSNTDMKADTNSLASITTLILYTLSNRARENVSSHNMPHTSFS